MENTALIDLSHLKRLPFAELFGLPNAASKTCRHSSRSHITDFLGMTQLFLLLLNKNCILRKKLIISRFF